MKNSSLFRIIAFISLLTAFALSGSTIKNIHDFTMMDIDGKEVPLSTFKGKLLLIVNVASKCGFTYQYEGLQKLYMEYKDRGFVILGFPANNFLRQEPGSNEDIKSFCSLNYGVSFPMFSKISVRGKSIHPLYQFLTGKTTNPKFGGKISWNFNKFLIGRKGQIINRFGSRKKPYHKKVINAIEKALTAD